jgi:hypothetical protein
MEKIIGYYKHIVINDAVHTFFYDHQGNLTNKKGLYLNQSLIKTN